MTALKREGWRGEVHSPKPLKQEHDVAVLRIRGCYSKLSRYSGHKIRYKCRV